MTPPKGVPRHRPAVGDVKGQLAAHGVRPYLGLGVQWGQNRPAAGQTERRRATQGWNITQPRTRTGSVNRTCASPMNPWVDGQQPLGFGVSFRGGQSFVRLDGGDGDGAGDQSPSCRTCAVWGLRGDGGMCVSLRLHLGAFEEKAAFLCALMRERERERERETPNPLCVSPVSWLSVFWMCPLGTARTLTASLSLKTGVAGRSRGD
jgi:hypothetical protein